jgi:mannonate dehydratase
VIPVAETAGVKMALHPDDPPISPLRGIGRILTSAKNYRRVLAMVPSPVNGITFCQANFKAMGEDLEALAREWCRQKKIFFIHFRDIRGTREHFVETFHDNGPTDMARMLQVYSENGFAGPIRPDHAPTLEGEGHPRRPQNPLRLSRARRLHFQSTPLSPARLARPGRVILRRSASVKPLQIAACSF